MMEEVETASVMSTSASTMVSILCCGCGTQIAATSATGGRNHMCPTCIANSVDLTEGIAKQVSIFYCKGCGRYMKPPWITAELESPELLAFCLKKIKGLNANGIKLVDAAFIWTEPHSRRLKVKVTIRREALNSIVLQQSFVVDFLVQYQQCDDCTKLATEHGVWKACLQVRQRVPHQRTFLFLEQLLIKHQLTKNILKVTSMPNGLDFFYTSRSHAMQLLDFLDSQAPIRSKQSKRLVSQDFNSNIVNYKYSLYCEIAPICRHDLICLDKSIRKIFGNPPPLLIIHRVSNVVQLIDPLAKCHRPLIEMDGMTFWKYEFGSLCTLKDLVEYVILDVEPVEVTGVNKKKFKYARVTCARASDIGVNDTTFESITHLGGVLHPGDHAMGYHVATLNANSEELDEARTHESHLVPDVILVKKHYPARSNRSKKRVFKLKEIEKEMDDEDGEMKRMPASKRKEMEEMLVKDKEMFMQEIEEDPELRALINLYANHDIKGDEKDEEDDGEEDGFPEIKLDELLQDLSI
jgi:nonsense-mediated mRNA decay protein 3